jgi:glyoxylase-like metal-dependent hydrolase (beta-lactamase superfamily II)
MPVRIAALCLSLASLAAFAAPPVPQEIAPQVYLLRGEFVPGRQPDGNSVLIKGDTGWIVIDTGRHVEHTKAVLDFAKPLHSVFNTHWHLDHTGGNVLVRREAPQAKIYASAAIHDALNGGFLANYAKQLEDIITKTEGEERERYRTELALIQAGKQLAPDETITASGPRAVAGRLLQVNLETHAVTAGDLWFVDKKTKTVIAGDLVTLPYPFLDTACPQRWKASLDHLAAVDFRLLVPGHGAPMSRKEFEQYRTAYDHLVACGASTRTNAQCADGWLTDIGELVPKSNADFVRLALDYYVTNFLRPDAEIAQLCGKSD